MRMGARGFTAWVAVAVASCVLLLACGCVYLRDRTVRITGSAMPEGSRAGLKAGETTREEVVAALGRPDQIRTLEAGTEVLTYVQERREDVNTVVLFLFSQLTHTTGIVVSNFEFKGGVLVRHWTEERR